MNIDAMLSEAPGLSGGQIALVLSVGRIYLLRSAKYEEF